MGSLTDKWRRATDIDVPAPTQFSLRPTVRMTARIHALMRLFPKQNKTELINDLIKIGLNQVIEDICREEEYRSIHGEYPECAADYEDEEARLFVTYYQEEVKSLLKQVDELSTKKGGKGKKVAG